MKDTASLSLTLDKLLIKRARVAAAKIGAPLNAVVSQQLQTFLDSFEQSEALGNQNFTILAEFSIGVRSANDAMKSLSIRSPAELNRLLAVAKLPKPTVSEHEISRMVEALQTLSSGSET